MNPAGRATVRWLFRQQILQENTLLHLDIATVEHLLNNLGGPRRGQLRINEFFRLVTERPIGRGVIATLAQQDDYMKRVRANGGARTALRAEGVVIFGDDAHHQVIVQQLGLPPLGAGESMSARLVRVDGPDEGAALIDGEWFRRCREAEEPTRPAPLLPRS